MKVRCVHRPVMFPAQSISNGDARLTLGMVYFATEASHYQKANSQRVLGQRLASDFVVVDDNGRRMVENAWFFEPADMAAERWYADPGFVGLSARMQE